MKVKHVITVVAALVVAVVVVVLLIVGISTHEEGGLLHPCFGAPGEIATYDDACPEKRWSDTPILVGTDELEYTERLRRAVKQANQELRMELFRLSANEAVVDFQFNVPHERGWFEAAGWVQHRVAANGSLEATVLVGNTGSDQELHYVLMHELGHVLFLDHDDFAASIMHTKIGNLEFEGAGSTLRVPHFTDHDRALIAP